MKKKLVGLAVAATLGFTALTASAEDMFRGAWYAVPGVSYMNTDSDLGADEAVGGFISIGKELSPSWDLQGRLGHNRGDEDTGIAGARGNYEQTTLGLDALYMFSRGKLRPFLLAGIGAARNELDYTIPGIDADSSKTSWLAGLGLGAQILLNDNFGLQADLRHQWSRAELDFDNSGTKTVGNTLFNFGAILRFGSAAPVVADATPEPAPIAAAPEPAPAPEPVKCTPQMDTISVSAEKLFGFDKANISDDGKDALNEAAAKIIANPELRAVIVTGHTDRIGSDAYNQKLSERRANIVKDYLAAQGVDPSIIETAGKGRSEPVVQCTGNKTTKKLIECLQPNRRVTIQAEGQKETGCN